VLTCWASTRALTFRFQSRDYRLTDIAGEVVREALLWAYPAWTARLAAGVASGRLTAVIRLGIAQAQSRPEPRAESQP
jgi:hypothetical protein